MRVPFGNANGVTGGQINFVGDPALLTGTAALTGKVVFLSPVVDPASGLQKVKLLFDNADGKVRPGLAGKLFIE